MVEVDRSPIRLRLIASAYRIAYQRPLHECDREYDPRRGFGAASGSTDYLVDGISMVDATATSHGRAALDSIQELTVDSYAVSPD
jgi:hypothetical protein